MAMASDFFSCVYKKVALLYILWSIWNLHSCCGTFQLETFETCGIFIRDFHRISNVQGDILHEIIDYLHLKQKTPQSLVIKTELCRRDIRPKFFTSMKYDCYLHVHINFVWKLFSTIPSLGDPARGIFYKKGSFLIIIKRNPFEMFSSEDRKLQLDRQYRIFAFRFKITHKDTRAIQLLFNEAYFFCPFCLSGFMRLKPTSSDILSLTFYNFKSLWVPELAEHYYRVYGTGSMKNQKFCQKQNAMYVYRKFLKCDYSAMLVRLITFASGCNFTLKLYASRSIDIIKIPTLLSVVKSSRLHLIYKYSSPVLRANIHPSIIYCLSLGRVTIAAANMWTKYVALNIWGLVGLFILAHALLNTPARLDKNVLKCVLQNVRLFLKSCFKSSRVIFRQSWGHKWKLLGLLELLFNSLIVIYENSITASVVVPLVPKPLSNTNELYEKNYTFVVQQHDFEGINDRLSVKYNTAKDSRVLGAEGFWYLNVWVEKYFLTQPNKIKYAIVGYLYTYFHLGAVKYLKEKSDTCYQMYPTEEAFHPVAFYFTFPSSAASSLHKSAMLLQAHGLISVLETASNFRDVLIASDYSRNLSVKYGVRGVTLKDIKTSRLNDSMITLGNIGFVCGKCHSLFCCYFFCC